MMFCLFVIVLFVLCCGCLGHNAIYMSCHGSDDNTGKSKDSPLRTLEKALQEIDGKLMGMYDSLVNEFKGTIWIDGFNCMHSYQIGDVVIDKSIEIRGYNMDSEWVHLNNGMLFVTKGEKVKFNGLSVQNVTVVSYGDLLMENCYFFSSNDASPQVFIRDPATASFDRVRMIHLDPHNKVLGLDLEPNTKLTMKSCTIENYDVSINIGKDAHLEIDDGGFEGHSISVVSSGNFLFKNSAIRTEAIAMFVKGSKVFIQDCDIDSKDALMSVNSDITIDSTSFTNANIDCITDSTVNIHNATVHLGNRCKRN